MSKSRMAERFAMVCYWLLMVPMCAFIVFGPLILVWAADDEMIPWPHALGMSLMWLTAMGFIGGVIATIYFIDRESTADRNNEARDA